MSLYWGKDAETVKALASPPPDFLIVCDCVYSEANVCILIIHHLLAPHAILFLFRALSPLVVFFLFHSSALFSLLNSHCINQIIQVLSLVTTMYQICGPDTLIYSCSELRNVDVWKTFLSEASKLFDCTKIPTSDLPDMDGVDNINVYTMKKKLS